jgi:hypothetical protein
MWVLRKDSPYNKWNVSRATATRRGLDLAKIKDSPEWIGEADVPMSGHA